MRVRRTTEQGAAAIEFALVLPFLLLLVFGIVDFGRAYYTQISLTQGAREGVRILALDGTAADVQERLDAGAATPLVPGAFDEVSIGSHTACTTAEDARLVLNQPFSFTTPLPGLAVIYGGEVFDTTITLSGEAFMRCEV